MLIAQHLRKTNIAEYLLYMWQVEELIRAFSLDMEVIEEKIIKPYQIAEEEKKNLYGWYESMIEMMKSENVSEKGHLQLTKNTLSQIEEFHSEVYGNTKILEYNKAFHSIQSTINGLRLQSSDMTISDMELCFNFLFGIMVLKMKGETISQKTLDALKEVSEFIKQLSYNFKLHEEGQLDLE